MKYASDQFIHCQARYLPTQQHFQNTFVYGQNTIYLRQQLWAHLEDIAHNIQEAWCILGDFNAVLQPDEQIGGKEIHISEITDFAQCIENCYLQEARSIGVFYTWTNKTVWSRIDKFLANSQWCDAFNYTHIRCLPEGLSDHSPLKFGFPSCPKQKGSFQFGEMWTNDPQFSSIVQHVCSQKYRGSKMHQLYDLL